MNIGLVVDDSLDRPDGVQQYVLTVGTWLSSQGHTVHYFAGASKRTDLPNLHVMSRNVSVRFNANRLTTPLPAKKDHLKKLLSDIDLDVLHVQMPYSPWSAGRLVQAAPKNTAVVGTWHILPYRKREQLATRLLRAPARSSLRRFDEFIAVSRPAGEFAHTTFGITAQVVPNTIDLHKFRVKALTARTKSPRVVFLGRLVQRKGAWQLLQALAAVPSIQKLDVILAGDGPDRPKLEAFAHAHKLPVTFLGSITEEQKAPLLASAEIAVFPSLSGESFGIVLLEAMASGAGVTLGGDNPGYRSVLESLPDSLIDATDTASFAARLSSLLGDSKLRQSIHVAQQQLVQQYDIQTVGTRLVKIYAKALRARQNLS